MHGEYNDFQLCRVDGGPNVQGSELSLKPAGARPEVFTAWSGPETLCTELIVPS